MDADQARRRLAEARVGRLGTVNEQGDPHVVPCCFVLRGDTVYTAVDGKPKTTAALRRLDNIRTHPRVSLLVDHYSEDWSQLWWVRVDGTARLLEDAPLREDLASKYEQYRRVEITGPFIAIEIDTWRSWP